MTDFVRINQPRVDKINDILAMIWKSANSQGVETSEILELLENVKVGKPAPENQEATAEPVTVKPPATLRQAPHIQQIAAFVASLPREQLPSWITHLVNRICEKEPQ